MVIAGSVGITAIILWILFIYLPRRSWDGDKESKPKDDE